MRKNSCAILIFFLSFLGTTVLNGQDVSSSGVIVSSSRVIVSSSVVENSAIAAGGIDFSTALEVTPRPTEEPSSTDSILRFWLKPQIVTNIAPVTNTFYFWTTSLDLDTCLQQNHLIRSIPSDFSYAFAYSDYLLYESWHNKSPLIDHLMGAERALMRDAWPCYWSDMDEFPRDSLKNQLVQVVLMDSSLIVSFFPDRKKAKRWDVHDLKGNSLTVEQAMKRKRHIAAVYMCSEFKTQTICGLTKRTSLGHFRGFVLCNENMIKSWHHAVPGLQAKQLQDLDYLLLLNAWFENPEHCAQQGKKGKVSYAAWQMSVAQMRISDMFFATDVYSGKSGVTASQGETMAIIEKLRERFRKQKNACERYPGRK